MQTKLCSECKFNLYVYYYSMHIFSEISLNIVRYCLMGLIVATSSLGILLIMNSHNAGHRGAYLHMEGRNND